MDVMWLISVEQGCDSRNMDVHCEWIIERCKQRVDEWTGAIPVLDKP